MTSNLANIHRVELGRRDYSGHVYARCYHQDGDSWRPVFVDGNAEIKWPEYFCGSVVKMPGGILYPTDQTKGNLAEAIIQIENLDADIEEIASQHDGEFKPAKASLLLHGFHAPPHEVASRMNINDPRKVHQLAAEFVTGAIDNNQFDTIDSNYTIDLTDAR
jgi:hypothetical protein